MAACFWGMGLKAYSEPMPQKQGPRAAMDGDQEGGTAGRLAGDVPWPPASGAWA